MFGKTKKHPLDDTFILSKNSVPTNAEMVVAIGRAFSMAEVAVGEARYDPTYGWSGMHTVYAWKPISAQAKSIIKTYNKN